MKDYYKILGIDKKASKAEVRKAFIHLSKKYHPDVNNDNEYSLELFKGINEAYHLLSNSYEREKYDYFLSKSWKHTFSYKPLYKYLITCLSSTSSSFLYKFFVIGGIMGIMALVYLTQSLMNKKEEKVMAISENTKKTPIINLQNNTSSSLTSNIPSIGKAPGKIKGEKLERTMKKSNVYLERPVLKEKKTSEKKNTTTLSMGSVSKELTNAQMNVIFGEITSISRRTDKGTNCVKIFKTNNSNFINGFDLATFLQSKGFTIAGRETIRKTVEGIKIDIRDQCILITIGFL